MSEQGDHFPENPLASHWFRSWQVESTEHARTCREREALEARLVKADALVEAAKAHKCKWLVKHAGDLGTCPHCEALARWKHA